MLALALGFLLLLGQAGCGGDDPGTSAPPATTSSAASEEGAASGSTTTGERAGAGGTEPDGTKPSSEGGDAGSAAASPEQAARLFLVSPDAELVCSSVLDPDFLKATYGDLSGCRAGRRPATLARDPGLGEPRAADGRALLIANPRGGLYDDQRLVFAIAEVDDGWRIERITSNVQVGP